MKTQQEDHSTRLAAASAGKSTGAMRSVQSGPLEQSGETGSTGDKASLKTMARRLSGFRFKKSTSEYLLGRGLNERDDVSSSGGAGRLLVRSFLLFVALPPLIAFFYYAFVASDVYVAETKLTVRAAADNSARSSALSGGASSIIGKLGLGQSGTPAQDSRIILDYLKSRSAIEDVGGRSTLAEFYDRATIDWMSRLDSKGYAEELADYWKGKVTASVDTISNILTLRVKGYTPDDAQSLAQKLVSSSEALINNISRRSRADALRRAQEEVTRSMTELADVRLQLLNLQQTTRSIDPIQSAKQIATLISTLTLQKIQLESQLAISDSTGVKGRPGDRYLQSSLDVMNTQIQDLEAMLTGNKASSVSMQLKDFELLKLKQEFAEQIYTLARASYEEARRNIDKQQLYLVVVVPPFRPEYALFPRVFVDSILVFLACLVLWSIGALLVASVKDSNEL
jgi:capsular polysaccharide transport system permease protein